MDAHTRILAALGKGANVLGSWRDSYRAETQLRDWAQDNPNGTWDDLPQELQQYVEKVEAV